MLSFDIAVSVEIRLVRGQPLASTAVHASYAVNKHTVLSRQLLRLSVCHLFRLRLAERYCPLDEISGSPMDVLCAKLAIKLRIFVESWNKFPDLRRSECT